MIPPLRSNASGAAGAHLLAGMSPPAGRTRIWRASRWRSVRRSACRLGASGAPVEHPHTYFEPRVRGALRGVMRSFPFSSPSVCCGLFHDIRESGGLAEPTSRLSH